MTSSVQSHHASSPASGGRRISTGFASAAGARCWLAGLLACSLAGLLACWLAAWLAGWLVGWLAGLLAGWLACLLAGRLAGWLVNHVFPKHRFSDWGSDLSMVVNPASCLNFSGISAWRFSMFFVSSLSRCGLEPLLAKGPLLQQSGA